MIDETIDKIEARLKRLDATRPENKEELFQLLSTLKSEVGQLAQTHADDAESIAGFADLSTHEAVREEKNPELLKHSLAGFKASVARFEQSHPRLAQIVNSFCTTLSNLGI